MPLLPLPTRASLLAASLALVAGSSCQVAPKPVATFAPGASLSEDEALAAELQESLSAFLEPLRRGEWSEAHTDLEERERYPLFYKSLQRGARDAEPVVLKAYPLGDGHHLVTVAFLPGAPDALRISRIVEFEAVPMEAGFRFRTPYERHTAHLQRRTLGDITYRFSGPFDEERAAEFAQFKSNFEALLGLDPKPLQYDCFQDLDELLRAYGLVHDASKCNFLLHDLGFLWHDGERYATGTGDERYTFGYVSGLLSTTATYRPMVVGVAAYYGGYSLSGDSMPVLARQFREELERRPSIDFLEEFEKGRGSSIERHFCHFVMCAFLYEELVKHHGEAVALRLLDSEDEAQFFQQLESLLGVTRDNFHATIVRLIGAHG